MPNLSYHQTNINHVLPAHESGCLVLRFSTSGLMGAEILVDESTVEEDLLQRLAAAEPMILSLHRMFTSDSVRKWDL